MGEVWRARHVKTDLPVAVKVITEEAARLDDYVAFFANEVRAVVRLSHPGIIHVFEHGKVDAAARAGTRGRMVAGSPYLVMEMASGSLDQQISRPPPWSWTQPVLRSLLDALAHPHTRGGNSPRPQASKCADFFQWRPEAD